MRDIIIFTQFYPYTYYDVYFERELFELSKYYERIFLVSGNLDSNIMQPIPANAKVYRYLPNLQELSKFVLLRHLFSIDFFREMMNARKTVPWNNFVHAAWYALTSLEKSKQYRKFITTLSKEENISLNNLTVYSYWMHEHAHAAGKLKKGFPQMKVIVRAHGSDLYFARSPIHYLPLRKLIFEGANAAFFISEFGKNYFQSYHQITGKAATRLRISRLGLVGIPSPQLKDNTEKKNFRIVSNAYVQPLKRIDLIAEALSEIKDLQIEWIHFGGMHHHTLQFNLFKKRVSDLLKQNPNITFSFDGDRSNEEIISFYNKYFVDLFINVSTTEGIPISIMEAFSFSIPAIATAVGGNPEIVNDENGTLVPADVSKTVLANAIRNYLQKTPAEKEKIRLSAFNTWKEKFNADVNYPKFVQEVLAIDSTAL